MISKAADEYEQVEKDVKSVTSTNLCAKAASEIRSYVYGRLRRFLTRGNNELSSKNRRLNPPQ